MKAEEQYKSDMAEINGLLNQIKGQLKRHEKDFKKDKNNWGYCGELNTIKNELEQTVEFLANSL